MMAFEHHGFWHPMDTLREKNQLRRCGNRARHHGRYGPEARESRSSFLARQTRPDYRTHRVQGRLARALAARSWAPRHRDLRSPPTVPSLFELRASAKSRTAHFCDVRDAAGSASMSGRRTGNRLSPRRAAAGTCQLRRPARHVFDERAGYGQPLEAVRRTGPRSSSSSPRTRSIGIASTLVRIGRTTPWAATTLTVRARQPRSWWSQLSGLVPGGQGCRRGHGAGRQRHRRR